MIRVGHTYKATNVKHPKIRSSGELATTFGVMVMDKSTKQLLYYTMFVEEALDLQNEMMITVTKINAIKSNKFRGNQQTTVYCELEIGSYAETKHSRDNLPF